MVLVKKKQYPLIDFVAVPCCYSVGYLCVYLEKKKKISSVGLYHIIKACLASSAAIFRLMGIYLLFVLFIFSCFI